MKTFCATNTVATLRNFTLNDDLISQVQTVSISYLRCLIEHVRCYILDRDIELVYYTIRKSSDVLTRDPMQLGAQVTLKMKTVFIKKTQSNQFFFGF